MAAPLAFPWVDNPGVPSAPANAWSADVFRALDHSSEAMLWRSLGRLSFGFGVQQSSPLQAPLGTFAPTSDVSQVLVGLSVSPTRWSTLIVQSSPARAARQDADSNPSGMVIVLKTRDPYRDLWRGLLKMDVGQDSTLGLRLRRKQVMLQFNKTW